MERICPSCGKNLVYENKRNFDLAIKLNKKCHSCATKLASKNLSEQSRYKIGSARRGKPLSKETLEKLSKAKYGVKRPAFSEQWKKHLSDASKQAMNSPEMKEKFSKMFSGENNPMFGKNHTVLVKENQKLLMLGDKNPAKRPEVREKMRASRIRWMKNNQIHLNISKSETLFLNEIESKFNIKFDKRQFYLDGRYFDAKFGKSLIEVDGRYWHDKDSDIDAIKEDISKKNGYKIYRFEVNSEKEVFGKIEDCSNRIKEFIGLACT